MYEPKHSPLLPLPRFYQRMVLHFFAAVGLLVISLGVGMLGFVVTEKMSWIDAFLNAAMLLGGMGQVNPPLSFWGKLFAGLYALYAGLIFIICAALVLSPAIHRLLHRFHIGDSK